MKKLVSHIKRGLLLTSTISLMSCGGGDATTNSDFTAVEVSAPVSDWELVWSDEFDGNAINANNWTHEVNCAGGGNNEKQCYTESAENSFVANGFLNIVALPAEDDAQKPYTSARMITRNKADFKYGRIEVRAKMPYGQGSWPAIWMMPTDSVYGGWPRSGEIDIVETVNLKAMREDGTPENYLHGTIHYGREFPNNDSSGKAHMIAEGVNPADDFHTYAIEWQEGEIRWYVDDYLYATQMKSEVRYNSNGDAVGLVHKGWYAEYYDPITGELTTYYDNAPFDQEFHLIMNVAVGGNWPENVNELGIDPDAFVNGQSMQVDFVRVYQCSVDPDTGKGCETVRQGYKDPEDALVEGKAPVPSLPPAPTGETFVDVFSDDINPNWPLWDCCGGSTPVLVMDDVEYGAVAEFTIGAEPTVMGFISRAEFITDENGTPSPFDASGVLSSGVISFDMKVVSAPSNPDASWLFKVESDNNTTAVELPLTASIEGQAPVVGEWQTYTYSLQSLSDAGLDVSAIDVVMIFPAWGSGEGAVYRVDNVLIGDPEGSSPAAPSLDVFINASNPNWPLWDCCGGSMPTIELDDDEHAEVAQFVIGDAPTVMGFISRAEFISDPAGNPSPFDASAIITNGVVQFDMKVVTPPANADAAWLFKIESDNATTAVELPLSESVEGATPVTGEWQTYTFNIADLADRGLDVSAIDVLMIFPTWGTGNGTVYRVDNVRIYDPTASAGFDGYVLFADQVLEQWSLWDCCAGTTPTLENDDTEHGAVAEYRLNENPTVVGIFADDGVYLDASSLLANGVVQFEMKVVTPPSDDSGDWLFKIESGDATTAVELKLSDSQEGMEPVVGEWQTYTYHLQDLFDAGLDISSLDVIMVFPTWGTGNGTVFRLDNVMIYDPSSMPAAPGLTLFKDASNPEWPIWDCCGGSTPQEVEDDTTHGTVAEFSIGAAPTVMGFLANEGVYFDASNMLQNGAIRFEMKVVSAPADPNAVWKFKVEAGDVTSEVELDLSQSLEGVLPETGEWQTYTYRLQDLFDAGLDISQIDVVMIFPAWGTGEGAVYRVDNAYITTL